MNQTKIIAIALLIAGTFVNCSGDNMGKQKVKYDALDKIPERVWVNLGHKRIYFGHQSVGYNIIDGIQDVVKENEISVLNIIEVDKTPGGSKGFLAHSPIGENYKPVLKIEDFKNKVTSSFNGELDVAFFKFCWVDVDARSNIEGLFNDYKKAINELKAKHPNIIFVHATVPLFEQKKTWKTVIKEFIGKNEIWEYNDNIMRNKINQMIRNEYEGKEPVFDLAAYESTYMDGKRETFKVGNTTYYSMVPVYASDGGHLNELGRKTVASHLLLILANAMQ